MNENPHGITATLTLETIITQTAPEAYAVLRNEVEAVPAESLVLLNLNVLAAARRGLVVAERIAPLLPDLATVSLLDFRLIETMGTRALAVFYAHDMAAKGVSSVQASLPDLVEEAVPLRGLMLSSAEVLTLVGLMSSKTVAAIRSGRGHVGMANGLLTLGLLYQERWDDVRNKVPLTLAMVERAITLSAKLHQALGVREVDDDPLAEPADPHHRLAQAFTLFARAYDECRRGVSHLRWHHGDARSIVPSLYVRRKARPGSRARKVAGAGDGMVMAASDPMEASRMSTPEPETDAKPVAAMAIDVLIAC